MRTLTEEISMFINDWKKDVFTIPNLLSLLRLILIPVYVAIYLNANNQREHFISAGILTISCLTDMIDGQIARRFNMISTLGKILDPLADKLTQLTLIVCLSVKYPVLRLVLVLFVFKEGFQFIAGVVNLCHGKMLPGALPAGKVCTGILFASLIIFVLIPDIKAEYVRIIGIIDIFFLSYSFLCYIFAYIGKNAKVQDL